MAVTHRTALRWHSARRPRISRRRRGVSVGEVRPFRPRSARRSRARAIPTSAGCTRPRMTCAARLWLVRAGDVARPAHSGRRGNGGGGERGGMARVVRAGDMHAHARRCGAGIDGRRDDGDGGSQEAGAGGSLVAALFSSRPRDSVARRRLSGSRATVTDASHWCVDRGTPPAARGEQGRRGIVAAHAER